MGRGTIKQLIVNVGASYKPLGVHSFSIQFKCSMFVSAVHCYTHIIHSLIIAIPYPHEFILLMQDIKHYHALNQQLLKKTQRHAHVLLLLFLV